ncbi:MAG TPA: class I SAM-dependent methyltransferase [Burkholderiaceae bacterium]
MLVRFLSILRIGLKRLGLLPWIKRWLYKPGHEGGAAGSAHGWRYRLKLLIEQANFAAVTEVHDVRPIQAYWAGRYVLPLLESFGFRSLDDFWAMEAAAALGSPQTDGARILSLGSGNCDFEVKLAQRLRSMGYSTFRIDCMDINASMLQRGLNAARAAGLGEHIAALRADFNSWSGAPGQYRVVLANQSLHHVVNLEGLFDAVASTLGVEGRFIIHEMIGRNGHMRWPEALQIVERFWVELPARYRFNRLTGTTDEQFQNMDCSRAGFEGIRAQDILPLLVQRFAFSLFIPFGNVIDVFIDRGIGPNFDPDREWDRAFIDRVHAADVAALRDGHIKPTHLLATITPDRTVSTRCPGGPSPAACVRQPA